ncbi:hypothetical protein M9458_023573, partial [Cirrhinus mrigala]
SRTWPFNPVAPPWLPLLHHCPLSRISGFALDSTPPATPHPSVPLALSGSSFPPAPPWSSVTPVPQWPPRSLPPPQSLEPSAPPWPSGSLALHHHLESFALPPPWLLPPLAPLLATIMAVAWVPPGSSCSLLASPWLHPSSYPPWTLFVVLLPDVHPPPDPPPVCLPSCQPFA